MFDHDRRIDGQGIIILGYPKSGSNFLNYCIEELYGSRLILSHGHHNQWLSKHQLADFNLIFMLRNYKECIPRLSKQHHHCCPGRFPQPIFQCDTRFISHAEEYLELLKHYDELEKDKMLVYYEDFILDPVATLKEVEYFLAKKFNIISQPEIKQRFYETFDTHREKSMSLYYSNPIHQPTATSGGRAILFHSHGIAPEDRKKMDRHMRSHSETEVILHSLDLWKYLKRYEEKNVSK